VSNSGVITALDGAASQYVRGDGTLADFPTSTGGGSSVSYYLNSSVSQGTIGGVAYRQLGKTPIAGAGTDIAISANGYVASYLTDANDPALLEVPAGNFNCEFYFSVNNNTGDPFTYAEVYKYDGTTFTLLGTSVGVPEYITEGTVIKPYYFAIPVAQSVLTVTDRIAIRIYVNVDGRTVTLHTENNHLCQVVTTFSKGLISLNNLTRQNQFFATGTSGTDFGISSSVATHTFNLPIASATNTGKLSSTDWSTFNNKQAALTFTAPLDNTSNTISIPAASASVDGYLDNLDWTKFNTAYNDSIISAAVTGTTTKTLTLNQQDGGTITASWTDDNTDAVTSVFGRTGAVVAVSGDYNTSQVTELTNLYFTDARARAALSAGTGISYNNTTGVITSTITQYTDALARSAISLTTTGSSGDATYNNTTGVFNIPNYGSALSAYLPLAGGIMTGQIVLKEGATSTDYTKGLRFPNDPYGGSGDVAGMRLYPSSGENMVLELYTGNDGPQDAINFATGVGGTANNDSVTINGNRIWNAGNLTPQTQLNGTGFVKASGTTISYDNSTYLTTSSAASTYVPYTGANANLQMGSFDISLRNLAVNNVQPNGDNLYDIGILGGFNFRNIYAYSFVKKGGTSSQFLKADGSVDSTSYYPTSGGIISGNIYMQSSANPSQLLAKGVNTEFWVDSQYGGGTARAFINRNGVGNQATLMFSTGVAITNGTAWAGVCDYSMGMTNDGTGNFYIGAGDLFSSSNRALTITPSKNVGIGTSSGNVIGFSGPMLTIAGTGQGQGIEIWRNSNTIPDGEDIGLITFLAGTSPFQVARVVGKAVGTSENAGSLSFQTSDGPGVIERMRITSSGQVQINSQTSSNDNVLKLFIDSTQASIQATYGTTGSYVPIRFLTSDTERMRITSGGYLKASNNGSYLNATGPYYELRQSATDEWIAILTNTSASPYGPSVRFSTAPNNTSNWIYHSLDSSTERFKVASNGGIYNYSANNVNLSDINTKKDIIPIESYWDKFKAIEIVKFKYKDQTHDDFNIGVIAQQVESVAPEFVDTDMWTLEDEQVERKAIYTSDLHHATIKVLQECMAKIEEQQTQIEELKELIKNK
jgi:hypothetical protein